MSLASAAANLPSARLLLERVADDLEQGQTVCALLPRNVESGPLWDAVRERLRIADCPTAEVWLPDIPTGPRAPIGLASALGVCWPSEDTPRTAENLTRCRGLPKVIYLDGLASLTGPQREEWLVFAHRWAAGAGRLQEEAPDPTALCIMAQGAENLSILPDQDVWFRLRWWWAVPSALEMQLLCRAECGESGWELFNIWREHLLPSLVGGDVHLASAVWEEPHWDGDSLMARLVGYALQNGWTKDRLITLGVDALRGPMVTANDHRLMEPPPHLRSLWAEGLITWTPEYGAMLSAAALACLGERSALEHRLWRAQVGLLMPLINEMRLALCSRWTHRYGPDWPSRWQLPAAPDEAQAVLRSPLACGWGHIETLLRYRAELARERWLLSGVSHAHDVRNRLAHSQLVTFSDFQLLSEGGADIGRT